MGYWKTATGRFEPGLWFLTGCMIVSGLLATQVRIGNIRKHNEKNS